MGPPKSNVWSYFKKNSDGTATCQHCEKKIKTSGNTSNLMQHYKIHASLASLKGVEPITSREVIATQTTLASNATLESDFENRIDSTPVTTSTESSLKRCFSNIASFKDGGARSKAITGNIASMIFTDSLPFSIVEGEGFKKLMKTVAPLYKVPSRFTITNIIDQNYCKIAEELKGYLQEVSYVSLTADIWTDLQLRSFLGITCHFLKDFKLLSAIIACDELDEGHTAENISKWILEALQKWSIPEEKVVSLCTDNAANMVKAAEDTFSRKRHIRCMAHTLNLVAQKTLKIDSVNTVLAKVRQIVSWFHRSVVAADDLRKHQRNRGISEGNLKKLITDVLTRWNSVYYMVERFLELVEYIGIILLKHPNAPTMISASELEVLKDILKLLQPLESVTRELCGEAYITGSKVIPIIHCLKDHLVKIIPHNETTTELKTMLLLEIEKRFGNIQKVHLLSVATLLDPRFKKIHLNDSLATSAAQQFIIDLINNNSGASAPRAGTTPTDTSQENAFDIWSSHHQMIQSSTGVLISDECSEFNFYLNTPIADLTANPLNVWRNYEVTFPKLSIIAFKYMLVLAPSAPSERLFSKAGNTLRKARSRILGKRLSKLMFLNSLNSEWWENFI